MLPQIKMYIINLAILLIQLGTSEEYEFCKKTSDYQPEGTFASCSTSGDDLRKGRLVNGTVTRLDSFLPVWMNISLAREGQAWARQNYAKVSFSHLAGLVGVLAFPDAYMVLHFTNTTTNPKGSCQRYADTIKAVSSWYMEEIKEDLLNNKWLDSLLRVRGFHEAAMVKGNKRLLTEKRNLINPDLFKNQTIDEQMWGCYEKDLNNSKIPNQFRAFKDSYGNSIDDFYAVSQYQLAMTQFAFVGYPVHRPDLLHILDATEHELMAFNHLWAVIGYVLGIEDKYNIALQPDLKTAKEMYKFILEHYYYPVLFNCNFYCKLLIESTLKGFAIISDILTPKVVMIRVLTDILEIPTPCLRKTLTTNDYVAFAKFFTVGMPLYFKFANPHLVMDNYLLAEFPIKLIKTIEVKKQNVTNNNEKFLDSD